MIDPDCPMQCNIHNQILDRSSGDLVPCLHCVEYARTQSGDWVELPEVLGFSESPYISHKLNAESLVPESEVPYLEEESYEELMEEAQQLWANLNQGKIPRRSYCFGLGIKGRVTNLAYPLLAAAHISGMTHAKVVTASEYTLLKVDSEVDELRDLYNSMVVIVVIEEGCPRTALQAVKGLMQTRALKHLPTIFITTWEFNGTNTIVDTDPDSGHFLAKPVFVFYTGQLDKLSNYSRGIKGLDNSIDTEGEY